MKQTKFNLISALLLALSLGFTASAPVWAHDGSSNSGRGSSSSGNSEDEVEVESHVSSRAELRHKAREFVAELRQEHKSQRTEAEKKHQCEAHKHGLETKFERITSNSQRIQDRIGGIMDKAIAYQSDKNLTVDNWDSLVQAANDAEQASDDSIAALQSVTPTLDCNNVSVADDVATFKTAAKETRDNLKAYRQAVKNVIQALLSAKQADNAAGSDN